MSAILQGLMIRQMVSGHLNRCDSHRKLMMLKTTVTCSSPLIFLTSKEKRR